MTNAEKYLKDGIDSIRPLLDKCREIGAIDSGREYRIEQMLKEQVKPTLSEDERVILRNIDKKYKYIGRTDYDAKTQYLYVNVEDGWKPHIMIEFDHLFQFIQNGEEYPIEELLKGE